MAIIINTNPSGTAFNEVGNCIKWNITMSSTGSGAERRRFGYQLKTLAGLPITKKESLSPKAGVPFDLDFRRDVLPFVKTKPPTDNSDWGAVNPEAEMLVEVQLDYWEIVHNSDDCTTIEEGADTDGPYKIVNSASNWFFPVEKTSPALLNRKPNIILASPKLEDFLYYYKYSGGGGVGPSTISATIYGSGGSVIGSRGPEAIVDGVKSYPVGPGNIYNTTTGDPNGAPSAVKSIRVFTDLGDVVTYIMEPCGTGAERVLFFQSTDGGYTGISFVNERRTIQSSYTEICRYNPSCEPWDFDNLKNGGESINDKNSYQELTLVKYIEEEDHIDLSYYEQFLSSGSFYIMLPWRYTELDGRFKMLKFLPSAGNMVFHAEEKITVLTIKGKINVPYNLPNYAT